MQIKIPILSDSHNTLPAGDVSELVLTRGRDGDIRMRIGEPARVIVVSIADLKRSITALSD